MSHFSVAVSGQVGSGSTESESQLVDNLLYDIRSGFQQKKGLERDIRVRSMASEEEVSIPGSPMLQRRRLGSFSGQSPDQPPGSGKDDTYSPGLYLSFIPLFFYYEVKMLYVSL